MNKIKLARSTHVLLASAVVGVGGIVVPLAIMPAASAAPAHSAAAKTATVVEKVKRKPIGEMLADAESGASHGLSLYIDTGSACTGGCLEVWPPLLMPTGKTVPKGASCLGTIAFGSGQRQVTYHKKPLYTFSSDSGTSVDGNGVGGFKAAKITKSCP